MAEVLDFLGYKSKIDRENQLISNMLLSKYIRTYQTDDDYINELELPMTKINHKHHSGGDLSNQGAYPTNRCKG